MYSENSSQANLRQSNTNLRSSGTSNIKTYGNPDDLQMADYSKKLMKLQREKFSTELDQLEHKLEDQIEINMAFLQPQIYKQQQLPTEGRGNKINRQGTLINIKGNHLKSFGNHGGYNEMGARMQRNIHFDMMQKKLETEIANAQLKTRINDFTDNDLNQQVIIEKKTRRWLLSVGKANVLDFTDDELAKLKECFDALDEDGSGAIGIEELEEPLIGLGFYDDREQVMEMIMSVDDDGSGEIEFREFCEIIKNSDKDEKTALINKFFKDLSNGTLGSKDKNFTLIYSEFRRQHMMDRFLGQGKAKVDGQRILKNVAKQIEAQKIRAAIEEEQDFFGIQNCDMNETCRNQKD